MELVIERTKRPKDFKQFKQGHGSSFTTEVKKVFKEDRKQINKGDIIRAAKEIIEQQWKETAVERLVSIY